MKPPDATPSRLLLHLKVGLQNKNPLYCGQAPAWIVDRVLAKLDEIDVTMDFGQLSGISENFAMGGIRFVADQGSSECDVLLARLHEVFLAA
jgi:hypothetical protein